MEKLSLRDRIRETSRLWGFSWLKIPLIGFIAPKVIALSEERVVIEVPLTWRTRNHVGSMYFGVMCTAADVAGGVIAMKMIRDSGKPIQFVFKDFKATFLKRAMADVHFISDDGAKVVDLVGRASSGNERVEETVHIYAVCPSLAPDQRIAEFELTISLKKTG